jgi:hypothetical protein
MKGNGMRVKANYTRLLGLATNRLYVGFWRYLEKTASQKVGYLLDAKFQARLRNTMNGRVATRKMLVPRA